MITWVESISMQGHIRIDQIHVCYLARAIRGHHVKTFCKLCKVIISFESIKR